MALTYVSFDCDIPERFCSSSKCPDRDLSAGPNALMEATRCEEEEGANDTGTSSNDIVEATRYKKEEEGLAEPRAHTPPAEFPEVVSALFTQEEPRVDPHFFKNQ